MSKNKQSLQILLAGLLILTFTTQMSSSSASNKASGNCLKAGQIATINSLKYVCQKSGKKLIWIKKVISKPVVSASANPTSKDSPKPVSTTSLNPIVEKVNRLLVSQLPTTNINEVPDTLTGTIVAESTIDIGNISETRRILRQIYLAQPILNLKQAPIVILASTIPFIKSEYVKYCSDNIDWFPNQSTQMSNWNDWAFVGCLTSTPVQVVPLPTSGVPVAHIEGAIGSDLGYLPIGLGPNTKKLPTWFVRGLKGIVGEYTMSLGKNSWQNRQPGISQCLNVKLSEISYSYEDVSSNFCAYSLGIVASRYVVAIKGLTPTLEFINELQKTGVWSEQIFSIFLGMPFLQFESEVKNYASGLTG